MFNHIERFERIELKRENIKGRRWYYLPNGQPVLSVTTILGHEEKPGLIAWQQSLGQAKANKETNRCADRGTAVHDMLEKYLKNDPDPTDNHDIANVRLFNQMKLKAKRINNIYGLELPVYSEEMELAGTTDCIGEYENILSIIDFKTSNNYKDKKIIHDYILQCTAYALCVYEMYGIFIEDYVIIMGIERGVAPMVFQGKIISYIEELQNRITTTYNDIV